MESHSDSDEEPIAKRVKESEMTEEERFAAGCVLVATSRLHHNNRPMTDLVANFFHRAQNTIRRLWHDVTKNVDPARMTVVQIKNNSRSISARAVEDANRNATKQNLSRRLGRYL